MPFDRNIKTVVCRMFEMMRMIGGVPPDLLRYTTDIDARSTQPSVFDDRDACTVLGGALRMRQTATAATDHEQFKIFSQPDLPSR